MRWTCLVLLLFAGRLQLVGQGMAERGSPRVPKAPFHFVAPRTRVLWWHTGAMGLWREESAGPLHFKVRSLDPALVKVEPEGAFLPGEHLAFVHFRGVGLGVSGLKVWGPGLEELVTEVEIVRPRVGDRVTIRSPAPGALLLGGDSVVVEALGREPVDKLSVRLDNTLLRRFQGRRRGVFPLPFDLRPGRHRLVARVRDRSGREATTCVPVRILGGTAGRLVLEAEKALVKVPGRKSRGRMPRLLKRKDASGGQAVLLAGFQQVLTLPVTVPRAGAWQIRIRAGGQSLGGEPPLLGLFMGRDRRNPRRVGVVATREFSVLTMGRPLHLAAGQTELRLRLLNGRFDGPGARRMLYLDRLSLLPGVAQDLDVEAPRLSVEEPREGELVGPWVPLNLRALDRGGIKSLAVWSGRRRLVQVRRGRLVTSLRLITPGPGDFPLRFVATDRAGNQSSLTRRVVVRPYLGLRPMIQRVGVWRAALPKGLQKKRDRSSPMGWRVLLKPGRGALVFPLRLPRRGLYRLGLVARAPATGCRLQLLLDGKPSRRVNLPGGPFQERPAGFWKLSAGLHKIAVGVLAKEATQVTGGGGGVELAGLILRQRLLDREPPQVRLLRAPTRVVGPDLVLVSASDNGGLASLRLVVDGAPRAGVARPGQGRLWLRGDLLAPGRHGFQVEARDGAGNVGRTSKREVEVERPGPDVPLTELERARLLTERLGYGGGERAVAALLLEGEKSWLERQLRGAPNPPRAIRAAQAALLRRPHAIAVGAVRRLLLEELCQSREPLRERLAVFWRNHFNTWIGKTDGRLQLQEVLRFRKLASTSFRELLEGSARSPAMLRYLDNQQNRRGRPNENYGREILELHTLGVHGGYTQADVIALSRILTGWRADLGLFDNRFSFASAWHDHASKRGLGVLWPAGRGLKEGEELLDLLAAHPSTARFISSKLAAHFVADEPDPELVARMARRFLESGSDIPEVVESMLRSPFFFRRGLKPLVKDPLEFLLGFYRAGLTFPPGAGLTWLGRLDRRPFDCVPPTGFPEQSAAWLDSGSLLLRWNIAAHVAQGAHPALAVTLKSQQPAALQAAIEGWALKLMARLPTARETALLVQSLAKGQSFPAPAALITAVLRLPSYQTH